MQDRRKDGLSDWMQHEPRDEKGSGMQTPEGLVVLGISWFFLVFLVFCRRVLLYRFLLCDQATDREDLNVLKVPGGPL